MSSGRGMRLLQGARSSPLGEVSLHIKATFYCSNLSRTDARTEKATELSCQSFDLEERPRESLPFVPGLEPQTGHALRSEERKALLHEDYDAVGCVHRNRMLGFDLDDLMAALFGHLKLSKKDGGHTADGEVVYFKRLAGTESFTGLPIMRIAPRTTQSSHASDLALLMKTGSAQDDSDDEVERERERDRKRRARRKAANGRMVPIYLLPPLLYTQMPSVLKSNQLVLVCFDLLRSMERFTPRFGEHRVYVDAMEQLRTNLNRVIMDMQSRAIAGEMLLTKASALERELENLRKKVKRTDAIMGELLDVHVTKSEEIQEVIFNRYMQQLVRSGKINHDGSPSGFRWVLAAEQSSGTASVSDHPVPKPKRKRSPKTPAAKPIVAPIRSDLDIDDDDVFPLPSSTIQNHPTSSDDNEDNLELREDKEVEEDEDPSLPYPLSLDDDLDVPNEEEHVTSSSLKAREGNPIAYGKDEDSEPLLSLDIDDFDDEEKANLSRVITTKKPTSTSLIEEESDKLPSLSLLDDDDGDDDDDEIPSLEPPSDDVDIDNKVIAPPATLKRKRVDIEDGEKEADSAEKLPFSISSDGGDDVPESRPPKRTRLS